MANVLFKWQALWENVVDTTRQWDLKAETSWQQAREADQLTLHARAKARAEARQSLCPQTISRPLSRKRSGSSKRGGG